MAQLFFFDSFLLTITNFNQFHNSGLASKDYGLFQHIH